MTFSRARLQGHRHGRGLTVRRAAHRAEVAEALIEQIEAGEHMPAPTLVRQLAAALQVPVSELASPEGTDYFTDYSEAFLGHLPPMSEADLNLAARALHRTTP